VQNKPKAMDFFADNLFSVLFADKDEEEDEDDEDELQKKPFLSAKRIKVSAKSIYL
jgi:hypothetical protein